MITEKIHELSKKVIKQAGMVEKMIKDSIDSLINRDREKAIKVIEIYEPRVNDTEIEIDEMVTNLIALYQPEAKHLRTILMILKMNNDLERIGDLAVNIAESSLFLMEKPPVKPLIDLPRMAEEVMLMLRNSILAFINEDTELAIEVCKHDDMVDALRDQIYRELITYMMSDPSTIERALHLMRISRNLERIADLATNICEDAIYTAEGKVIKHHRLG
ncbi:MAG: phosphate transport system regulatory protein PhoU [Thermoprotei archaeon]|nr:MAG: phosphate transport system regulatory protein PhoU [Thermoprotei archaeon]